VRTPAALVLLLSSAAACAPARSPVVPVDETPQAEQLSPDDAPIGFRRSVVADAWFWLRAKTLEGEAPPPFKAALAAMQELRGELGSDASQWEDLELPLGSASRASELVTVYGTLPERVDVGGRFVPLRALALRVATAMETMEPAFRRGPYKEHEAAISRAAKELSAKLVPHEAAIARAIEADMALPGAGRSIVITLVGDAPYPGGFAADDQGREIATFVRVRGLEGTALVETVLTESLHAIDEVTVKAPTAMNMLRGSLAQRGLDENGEGGFYTIFPPAPAIVAAWDRHVDGEDLQATTNAIATALGIAP